MKEKKSQKIEAVEEWVSDENETDFIAKPNVSSKKDKTMSVMQMGKILGLHKTDSYWLAHKNFFKIIEVAGQMRVDIESFEKWYKNQIKYKKIDGSPPGNELKEMSYSAKDIADILQISEDRAYAVMKRDKVPYIIVDYWRRWSKSVFDEWYKSQTRYRTIDDRKKDYADIERTLSMPEMRYILGLHRNTVYDILNHPKNKNIFEFVIVADQKRITKESFEIWYRNQNKYIMLYDTIENGQKAKGENVISEVCEQPQKKDEILPENQENTDELRNTTLSVKSENPDYYSIDDIVQILCKKRRTVLKLIRDNIFPATSVAGSYRIPKLEFDRWLIEKKEYQKVR